MTWLVVQNPAAGRGDDVGVRLRTALAANGIDHEHVVSRTPEHVAGLVAAGIEAGVRRFAAVGGDGTAHLVLNAMLAAPWEEPPVLAIIAAGSGSDFIRTFALPRGLEESVALLATDAVYRCDIGLVEGSFGRRYFLNALNVGVVAASAARADRLPRRLGGLRYSTAFWLALGSFRPGPVRVALGRRTIATEALTVVVANGQFFGGGLNIAPQAALMDGMVDVEVFSGPRRRAFSIMPRVVKGLHLRHPAVEVGRASSLSVTVPESWPVEADGELLGSGSVEITVVPAAVDFKI